MADFKEEEFEEFETVIMTDEDTGEEIEFAIIDNTEHKGNRYLLVVESEYIDDEESEAVILKEVSLAGDDVTYALVEDDDEFDEVADIFSAMGEEYDVEIDE
ncbi:hypothetical protein B5E58_01670 [Tyzzerella sp. An114]|uniref:DUF1292 domain-containing protein n=1 Tax=Tyzzerella sp. An114 TaxID=1965545 RepID=UPI000B44650B|nr:DUF1292 domain-containing protein [Tyzzerella sp. An114]OUQ60605.1 hypothetical protein B5E58_01670 [Tyzzerella sp. An114]HIT72073.1 DUF1292 domain-containing protein [Candidatus Fimicola cottocaccae]